MAVHRNETSKRNTILGERIRLYHKAFAKVAEVVAPVVQKKEWKAAG